MSSSGSQYAEEQSSDTEDEFTHSVAASRRPSSGSLRPVSAAVSPKRSLKGEKGETREVKRVRRTYYVKGTSDHGKNYGRLVPYEKLLRRDVEDSLNKDLERDQEILGPSSSQYGLIVWTVEEKALFFHNLDRKGRLELKAISEALGTKSEPEVADYLRLLHRGYIDRHLRCEKVSLCRYSELPAAFEIGKELEDALDKAAKAASTEDLAMSLRCEISVHGDLAVLDRYNVRALHEEDASESDHAHDALRGGLKAAAALLDLPKMLELSERIFMNSEHKDDNWQSLAQDKERPAIFQTAFLEMHKLVLSVTERIVHTAHFLALSRIRTSDIHASRQVSKTVRKQDVTAALDILGMPRDPWDFWVGCPRKCQLRLCDTPRLQAHPRRLTYAEAEERLAKRHKDKWEDKELAPLVRHEQVLDEAAAPVSSSALVRSTSSHGRSGAPGRIRLASAGASVTSEATDATSDMEEISPEDDVEAEEDSYADDVDKRNSKLEEKSLWQMLLPKPPDNEGCGQSTEPKPPKSVRSLHERKTIDELTDWRDWCSWKSMWEQYPQPIPVKAFAKDLHKLAEDIQTDDDMGTGGTSVVDGSEENDNEDGKSETHDEQMPEEDTDEVTASSWEHNSD